MCSSLCDLGLASVPSRRFWEPGWEDKPIIQLIIIEKKFLDPPNCWTIKLKPAVCKWSQCVA